MKVKSFCMYQGVMSFIGPFLIEIFPLWLYLSSYYNTSSVVICLGITILVCLAITIFSFQTKVSIFEATHIAIFLECSHFQM